MTPDASSVSEWLVALKGGDPQAAQKLWERYVHKLIVLAGQKLRNLPKRAADEEDVVSAAFESFFRGVQAGRFPRLDNRDDLWQVLVMLTDRRAKDYFHRLQARQKEVGESTLAAPDPAAATSGPAGLEQVPDPAPTPESAAEFTEAFRRRLASLKEPILQQIALLSMQGYTQEEIARQLDCSVRKVQRKMRRIRDLWNKDLDP